jgi:excisionase family DNA binding protein
MAQEWITTEEAAQIVGVTPHQIRHLLRERVLQGQKFARSWMVSRASAEKYAATERKPGPKTTISD